MQKPHTTTQVLVPLNATGTLHNHIHVTVRMKPNPGIELENTSTTSKKTPWNIKNDHTISSKVGKESFQFDKVFSY